MLVNKHYQCDVYAAMYAITATTGASVARVKIENRPYRRKSSTDQHEIWLGDVHCYPNRTGSYNFELFKI